MSFLLALAFTFSVALGQTGQVVTGVVVDESGGAVGGATVLLRGASGTEEQTVTGPDGRFKFSTPPDPRAVVVVRAGGFAEKLLRLSATDANIEIVLAPAALLETVTVTADRTEAPLGNIPASINILDAQEIKASPAVVADDILRQVPTFSLFRRTSSL